VLHIFRDNNFFKIEIDEALHLQYGVLSRTNHPAVLYDLLKVVRSRLPWDEGS